MKAWIKNIVKIVPFGLVYLLLQLPFLRGIEFSKNISPYFKKGRFNRAKKNSSADIKNKAKIIIYGLRTNAACNLAVFEKVFGDFFIKNGAIVKNLICGGCLPSCDGSTKGIPDWVVCRACNTQRKFYLRNYPSDVIYFKEFISKKEIKEIESIVKKLENSELENFRYKGVNVGRHAVDSVIFHFQFIFDRLNNAHRDKLRKSLVLAMIVTFVAERLFEKENPTHIFTLHGCYATWGPFADYLSKKGVTVYVYRKVLNPGMGYFDFPRWTDNPNDVPAREVWEKAKLKELTDQQKTRLQQFMYQKKAGKTADYKFFYEQKNGTDNQLLSLLNSDKKKFVIYLHQLWDRGFEEATSPCFDSHLNWIKETITYFGKLNDSYLFIKPHPAEYSIFEQGRHGGAEVIGKLFSDLPKNVFLIRRDVPYTSYDLMDLGCIGITYYGTVGLEHSYFKKPVIVGGDIHYADIGAVLKIKSKEDYFKLLSDPSPLFSYPVKNFSLIEKYAYHYYFRPNIRIPFIREDVFFLGHCIDWGVLNDYEDFVENNAVMNHIAKSIIDNKPVVNLD
jgi:hypothetical protein